MGSSALSQLVPSSLWVMETRRSSMARAVSFLVSSGSSRARLVESRPIGDVVLLRYALSPRFSEQAW